MIEWFSNLSYNNKEFLFSNKDKLLENASHKIRCQNHTELEKDIALVTNYDKDEISYRKDLK